MTTDPFKRFIDLVKFDQDLYERTQRNKVLLDDITNLSAQESLLNQSINDSHSNLKELNKRIADLESRSALLQQQKNDAAAKLEHVSTVKEYHSLTAEQQSLTTELNAIEDQLMHMWDDRENKKRLHEELVKKSMHELSMIQSSKKELQHALDQLQNVINTMVNQRAEYLTGFPQEWLERYNQMKDRVSDPVVPVDRGACSACFHGLVGTDLALLSRRVFLPCKGCYRLLYLPEVVG